MLTRSLVQLAVPIALAIGSASVRAEYVSVVSQYHTVAAQAGDEPWTVQSFEGVGPVTIGAGSSYFYDAGGELGEARASAGATQAWAFYSGSFQASVVNTVSVSGNEESGFPTASSELSFDVQFQLTKSMYAAISSETRTPYGGTFSIYLQSETGVISNPGPFPFFWSFEGILGPGCYSLLGYGAAGAGRRGEFDWEDIRTGIFGSFALAADANGDGYVTPGDYTVWADNFGRETFNGQSEGDFNLDYVVNGADYTLWADNYTGLQTIAAVPEPSAAALVHTMLGTLAFTILCRQAHCAKATTAVAM